MLRTMKRSQVRQGQGGSWNKHRGSSLVEVMITFLVVVSGLLVAIGMQINSLKNMNVSHGYEQTIALANGITERLTALGNNSAAINALLDTHTQTGDLSYNVNGNLYTITIQSDYDHDGADEGTLEFIFTLPALAP